MRVLSIHLTRKDLKTLRGYLTEQRGLSLRELQDLQRIVEQIDRGLGDYPARIDRVVREARARIAEDDSADGIRKANEEASQRLQDLDEELGAEEVDVTVSRDDYRFVVARWQKGRTWTGDDATRATVLALHRAITGATETTTAEARGA